MHMITRASVAVNDDVHTLSVDTDLATAKRSIVAAVHAGGDFVDMVVAGNRKISVLFTEMTSVTFSTEEVLVDFSERDREEAPYDEDYDQSDEGNWRHQ